MAKASFETPIDVLLSETLEAVREREQRALDELLVANHGRVVLVGAGSTGQRALTCLRSIGVEPLAIADNNADLHGTKLAETPVMALREAAQRFGRDAMFVIAIWNAKHWYAETAAQLAEAGCLTIVPIGPIYWRFPETFLPYFVQDLPHNVYAEKEDVARASSIWGDEQSRLEYLAHVRWRTHGEAGGLPGRPSQESYFADDIFSLCSEESLVDCGAYDGDTVRSFLLRRGSDFSHIDAIEPSPGTFDRLQRYVRTLSAEVQDKIRLRQCAVGARSGVVRFDANRGVDSQISDDGATTVDLSKMDIEGAEYEALVGARKLLQAHRPILAICLEHFQYDLWRLPLLIHDEFPDYRMFLRTYEGDGWQSVCYAVPPNRLAEQQLEPLWSAERK